MAKDTSGRAIKPKPFTTKILLPHFSFGVIKELVIKELKEVAEFHDTTLKEEATRALLRYHAKCMSELIEGKLT